MLVCCLVSTVIAALGAAQFLCTSTPELEEFHAIHRLVDCCWSDRLQQQCRRTETKFRWGQGVIWVEGGIDSEVPENAIRVLVGGGFPLCRGTLAEDQGQRNFWLDIGVVNPKRRRKMPYPES